MYEHTQKFVFQNFMHGFGCEPFAQFVESVGDRRDDCGPIVRVLVFRSRPGGIFNRDVNPPTRQFTQPRQNFTGQNQFRVGGHVSEAGVFGLSHALKRQIVSIERRGINDRRRGGGVIV